MSARIIDLDRWRATNGRPASRLRILQRLVQAEQQNRRPTLDEILGTFDPTEGGDA